MVKMLIFDLKESEKAFFKTYDTSDFEIKFFKESLNENTKLTVNECDETCIISIFTKSKINQKVLDKFKNLRLVSVRSNEYENIDIDVCRNRNIGVINIDNCQNNSIAQYVLGISIIQSRNVIRAINDFKNKKNRYDDYEGRDITKLSLGVIGTQNEGSAICKMAKNFGMNIYAHDLIINPELSEIVDYVPFIDLLRQSDIITIHLPYNKELRHLFSYPEFEIMKETAYLINTSQSDIIDIAALYNAIKNNKLKGAALDTIECENMYYELENPSELNQKNCAKTLLLIEELKTQPNIIITPRIAHNTEDSVEEILNITFSSIKDFYKGGHKNRVV